MRVRASVVALEIAILLVAAAVGSGPAGARSFTMAPHNHPPLLINLSKLPAKPLRLVSIVADNYRNHSRLAQFGKFVAHSQWLSSLETAYPPAAGAPNDPAPIVIKVPSVPNTLTAEGTIGKFQDFVFKTARAHGIHKNANVQTIYVMYIKCNKDGPSSFGMGDGFPCVGHHPQFVRHRMFGSVDEDAALFSVSDSLAVSMGNQQGSFGGNTHAASHEISEAYTDSTGVGNWGIPASDPTRPYLDAPPWVRKSGFIESADMAFGDHWYETNPATSDTYDFTRVYSNFRSKLNRDPSVPRNPNPYYNVSTRTGWFRVAAPDARTITVTGWSTAPIGDFNVTMSIAQSGGPAHCVLPADKTFTIHNGQQRQITVKSSNRHANAPTSWCEVEFETRTPSPAPNADGDHVWMTGFVFHPVN